MLGLLLAGLLSASSSEALSASSAASSALFWADLLVPVPIPIPEMKEMQRRNLEDSFKHTIESSLPQEMKDIKKRALAGEAEAQYQIDAIT